MGNIFEARAFHTDEMWFDDLEGCCGKPATCPRIDYDKNNVSPCSVEVVPYQISIAAETKADAERVLKSIRSFIPDYEP